MKEKEPLGYRVPLNSSTPFLLNTGIVAITVKAAWASEHCHLAIGMFLSHKYFVLVSV
jgi:hypothetical protein